jgi:hypothetical protein
MGVGKTFHPILDHLPWLKQNKVQVETLEQPLYLEVTWNIEKN